MLWYKVTSQPRAMALETHQREKIKGSVLLHSRVDHGGACMHARNSSRVLLIQLRPLHAPLSILIIMQASPNGSSPHHGELQLVPGGSPSRCSSHTLFSFMSHGAEWPLPLTPLAPNGPQLIGVHAWQIVCRCKTVPHAPLQRILTPDTGQYKLCI